MAGKEPDYESIMQSENTNVEKNNVNCSAELLQASKPIHMSAPKRNCKAPTILSMQEYIKSHYTEEMLLGLREKLLGGKLNTSDTVTGIFEDTFTICRMNFWRNSSRSCIAHIQAAIDQTVISNGREHIVRGMYSIFLTLDMTWESIETEFEYCLYTQSIESYCTEPMWKLDDYLVPILNNPEIEDGAWLLHCRYFLEHSKDEAELRMEYNAYEMARRMGLEIIELPLYKMDRTKGLLFFRPDSIAVAIECSNGKIEKQMVDVPADCIVLNTNCNLKDEGHLEVFHECIHYDWHYMFYRLQELHINDLRKLKRGKVSQQIKRRINKSLSYLEYQAYRGSYALMMPLSIMLPLVREQIERYKSHSRHAGDLFDKVGRAIADKHGYAKFRVRARLIQMGYIEAKGALNFVDGRYIEPFGFARDNGDKNYSFVIDENAIIEEYSCNSEFRKRMDSGTYLHVDGHICINDPQYVYKACNGYRLTRWANAHVDECCLRFISIYEQTETAEYVFGRLASDEEYDRHYLEFAGTDAMSEDSRMLRIGELVDEMPNQFHSALKYLMEYTGMTIEEMEEKAHISRRTVARLRTEEKQDYSIDQIIALCIAMHLPPMLSTELIERAGFVFRKIPLHRAYRVLLDCKFMDSVDEAQEFLKRNGYVKLKLNEAE